MKTDSAFTSSSNRNESHSFRPLAELLVQWYQRMQREQELNNPLSTENNLTDEPISRGGDETMAQLVAKKRIVPKAGRHLCTLISVNEVENKFFVPGKDAEDKKQRLEWIFSYDEKPEMQIRVWSSFSLSAYKGTKSNALLITEALLNKTLSDAEREQFVNTDLLIHKKCYLTVKHLKRDDGEVFAKVIDFEAVPQQEAIDL